MNARLECKLLELRKARGLSQIDIARSAGLSQRHISFLENNVKMPGLAAARRIATVLGVDDRDIWPVVDQSAIIERD